MYITTSITMPRITTPSKQLAHTLEYPRILSSRRHSTCFMRAVDGMREHGCNLKCRLCVGTHPRTSSLTSASTKKMQDKTRPEDHRMQAISVGLPYASSVRSTRLIAVHLRKAMINRQVRQILSPFSFGGRDSHEDEAVGQALIIRDLHVETR